MRNNRNHIHRYICFWPLHCLFVDSDTSKLICKPNHHVPALHLPPSHGSLPVCQSWTWRACHGHGKSQTCVRRWGSLEGREIGHASGRKSSETTRGISATATPHLYGDVLWGTRLWTDWGAQEWLKAWNSKERVAQVVWAHSTRGAIMQHT